MSKLSIKVQEIKKKSKLTLAVEKDKAFRDELCNFVYNELSDLRFNSYDYKQEKAYFLHLENTINGKQAVVRVLYEARTTEYKVILISSFSVKDLKSLMSTEKDVYLYSDIHNDKDEHIDIGELLFYCERHSEELSAKELLNEELDRGFTSRSVPERYRNQDLIKGYDKDDVSYNERLHRYLKQR